MSTPQSQIYICSGVRLDNRQQHTIHFRTLAEQREFFAGKVVKTFSAYSYHRRKWKLKVEASMSQAQQWNYLYIVQPGSPDYQYYFINAVNYLSDSTVELDLELDVMQTYMVNGYSLLPSFIERAHVSDDTPGANTVPEGLELGPYYSYHKFDQEDIRDMGVLVMSSINLFNIVTEDYHDTIYMQKMDGVYSGLGLFAYDDMTVLAKKLYEITKAGKIDAIVSIWMYPKSLVKLQRDGTTYSWDEYEWDTYTVAWVKGATIDTIEMAVYMNYDATLFEGYTPKNKKLYCHPFNLLHVSNNAGESADFRFEGFFRGTPAFNLFSGISPDAGVKIAPADYYGDGNAEYEQGLTLSNYPQCAWNSDTYKVWLAQNFNQLSHSMDTANMAVLGGAVTAIGSLAMGNVAGVMGGGVAMYSGYNQVQGILAQKEDAKTQPPQARGSFSSSVNVAVGRQTFTYYYKCITKEYAQQIDDFFTCYGYRINRVMIPNLRARKAFTFVKTVGCKITGALSNEDMTAIQSIFDNGITFWTNPNKVGDYTQDNTV